MRSPGKTTKLALELYDQMTRGGIKSLGLYRDGRLYIWKRDLEAEGAHELEQIRRHERYIAGQPTIVWDEMPTEFPGSGGGKRRIEKPGGRT